MAVLSALGSVFRSGGKWLIIILGAAATLGFGLFWNERKNRKAETARADAAIRAAKTAKAAMEIEAKAARDQRLIKEGLVAEREQNRIEAVRLRAEADRLRKERDAERKRIEELEPGPLTDELNKALGHSS